MRQNSRLPSQTVGRVENKLYMDAACRNRGTLTNGGYLFLFLFNHSRQPQLWFLLVTFICPLAQSSHSDLDRSFRLRGSRCLRAKRFSGCSCVPVTPRRRSTSSLRQAESKGRHPLPTLRGCSKRVLKATRCAKTVHEWTVLKIG